MDLILLIGVFTPRQGGITCEAIAEPRKSSKAIDKRVITNFRDKNVVIARFGDKNEFFILFIFIYRVSQKKVSDKIFLHPALHLRPA